MTNTLIQLTEAEFDARFPLVTNHLNPHASWTFDGSRGCLFETFGEELAFVQQQHPQNIWTLVDGEDGDLYLISGCHFVNRIGYLVSTVPVPEGATYKYTSRSMPTTQHYLTSWSLAWRMFP